MIRAITGPLISRPQTWVIAFDPIAENRWAALIPGRYKHVRAYGYVPFLHVWLFVDANFAGLEIQVAANGEAANTLAASWARGCDLVVMPRRPHANASLLLAGSGWCVPVVKRLIGLDSRALRPDALFAHCMRNGGILHAKLRTPGPASDANGGGRSDPGLHAATP